MHKPIEQMFNLTFANTIVALILFAFVQPLHALEFECQVGSDKRFIRMELPGVEHLCEVSVTYASQERKVMWYANNDSMFCSEKADNLRQKYQTEWDFQCKKWPDHDGVDQLSKRQRTILDAELKSLIMQGKNALNPFLVEGLKAAASPTTSNENDAELLVVQFFLHVSATGTSLDVTHIIRDNGIAWNTQSKIESLAQHIEADEGYVVDSALISGVTGNGALEVITALDSIESANSDTSDSGCYGNQVLATSDNGKLIAKTPHRFYCPKNMNADAG